LLQSVTTKVDCLYVQYVTDTVRIPSPVYDRVTQLAERKDVSRGVIIQEWMDKAEKYDELETQQYR